MYKSTEARSGGKEINEVHAEEKNKNTIARLRTAGQKLI